MTTIVDEHWTGLVPAIARIQDECLRSAVCSTWQESIEGSAYASVHDVPQSPHLPERSLLHHVNDVCLAAANLMEFSDDQFGLRPDADVTIAGAILHDVDKPLLYRRTEIGVVFQDGYGSDSHGPVGADLCLSNGVPEPVAELVRLHSPFRGRQGMPGSVEGAVVFYADLISADLSMVAAGALPFHSLMRFVPR